MLRHDRPDGALQEQSFGRVAVADCRGASEVDHQRAVDGSLAPCWTATFGNHSYVLLLFLVLGGSTKALTNLGFCAISPIDTRHDATALGLNIDEPNDAAPAGDLESVDAFLRVVTEHAGYGVFRGRVDNLNAMDLEAFGAKRCPYRPHPNQTVQIGGIA